MSGSAANAAIGSTDMIMTNAANPAISLLVLNLTDTPSDTRFIRRRYSAVYPSRGTKKLLCR